MKLWMTLILILLVLAVARWAKVREDGRRAWAAERERWEAERGARGVMDDVMDDYETFAVARRYLEGS